MRAIGFVPPGMNQATRNRFGPDCSTARPASGGAHRSNSFPWSFRSGPPRAATLCIVELEYVDPRLPHRDPRPVVRPLWATMKGKLVRPMRNDRTRVASVAPRHNNLVAVPAAATIFLI